jgi:sugar transferase (PEP-CTERM/EpsH1 system associated)
LPIISLHQRNGIDFRTHLQLWRLFRELRPAIVHTRNLPALEFLAVAALVGVPGRIHGEHGRDIYDLDGSNYRYRLLRKTIAPFVSTYTAVSQDLAQWLVRSIGVAPMKVKQICNGVDTYQFRPKRGRKMPLGWEDFAPPATIVIGTVGRMEAVKDQTTLVRAFLHLVRSNPEVRGNLRLIMVGDGTLRAESQKLFREADAEWLAWLPGERDDIPEVMRSFDLFVLPSIAEGISNTILEAMASGLPVIATNVGGNPELVLDGETGMLVPPSDPLAMSDAIHSYLKDPAKLARHGQAGRKRVEEHFSIERMVNGYLSVYDEVLAERKVQRAWGRG